MDPLLDVENLSVTYRMPDREVFALREISLQIPRGSITGLVGESGSGKTTLGLAIMGYLPGEALSKVGRVRFDGHELDPGDQDTMRHIWGSGIALVPQDPGSALNPSIQVGDQLGEILRFHLGLDHEQASVQAVELFRTVGLSDPQRVAHRYPHELSGGMQQRVLIAMAISARPKLLILDEPTSNLDSTTQAAVLDLLCGLIRDHGLAALFITHNLGIVSQTCDHVVVLYAGEVVEQGPAHSLFQQPLNPYTVGLLHSLPRLGENRKNGQLQAMPGRIPDPGQLPSGCIFKDRCPLAAEACDHAPPLYALEGDRSTRCHRWDEIGKGDLFLGEGAPSLPAKSSKGEALACAQIKVTYRPRSDWRDWFRGGATKLLHAVDGVDLQLQAGETLGLVGESGSGKTSLARALVGLVEEVEGDIRLRGIALQPLLNQRSKADLRDLQMVFQNSEEALNPYQTVGEILRRGIRMMSGNSRVQAEQQLGPLLESVQLSPETALRYPSQLSGGERQRVAIARAILSQPAALIADEAVSSLDASVQAAILNLLIRIQGEQNNALLFISHDLAVVGYLADQIAVIYAGQLMELAPVETVLDPPHHPYTQALLAAVPRIDTDTGQHSLRLVDELPSAAETSTGCPFHPRCPFSLGERCAKEEPPWRTLRSGKRYYCHLSEEELILREASGSEGEGS